MLRNCRHNVRTFSISRPEGCKQSTNSKLAAQDKLFEPFVSGDPRPESTVCRQLETTLRCEKNSTSKWAILRDPHDVEFDQGVKVGAQGIHQRMEVRGIVNRQRVVHTKPFQGLSGDGKPLEESVSGFAGLPYVAFLLPLIGDRKAREVSLGLIG